jgi:hypothetical protein
VFKWLTSADSKQLNILLSRFVAEARKTNGDLYPSSTIHQLLCGILRYMRAHIPDCLNFFNKEDTRFCELQSTLDYVFHKLHSDGIGVQTKHTEVLTKEDEEKLWKSGVMSLTTPESLQNAAFFVVGKMFCLRGGAEHRSLKPSQLKRLHNPHQYVYDENVSKTNDASFKSFG